MPRTRECCRIAWIWTLSWLVASWLGSPLFAQDASRDRDRQLPRPASGTALTPEVTPAAGQIWRVTAGDQDRQNAIVSIPLGAATSPLADEWRVVELVAGEPRVVPSQLEVAAPESELVPGRRLWWILPGRFAARSTRQFRLEAGKPSAEGSLRVERSESKLVVKAGERSILQYNSAHVSPPAGVDPSYGRSAFIHPVWTPSGAVVTEQFPADHLHQSGVFLAYTKAQFEGRDTNFWELFSGKGRVRFRRVIHTVAGPVFAQFVVEQEHVDLTSGAERVALRETWDIRVWGANAWDSSAWVWDVESTRRCAGANPLNLPKYHYGGMALRGASGWGGDKATFLTSDGLGREPGNHSRPRWCDLAGPMNGQRAGLTLATHPTNFRFPEPLRIHPSMPYMVYAPSHLGDWAIKPGEPVVSRYRFAAHDGDADRAKLDALWLDFAEPLAPRPAQ